MKPFDKRSGLRRRPRWAINWSNDHGKDSDPKADAGNEPAGPGGTELAPVRDEGRDQLDRTDHQSGFFDKGSEAGKRK